MIFQAVCGNGLGSSLLVAMNVREVLDKLNFDYEEVVHTNVSSFSKRGVDYVVCGLDVAPALDFPEEKKIKLKNILSKQELEEKLKKTLNIK